MSARARTWHGASAGIPYLGLGLGAQSFTHTTIAYNEGAAGKRLGPYRHALACDRLPIQDLYDLPARQVMAKMCAVSFYFGEIDRPAFAQKFLRRIENVFPDEIGFVLERGLMERGERVLRLTPDGALAVNGVIALFLAPSVQQYLLERGLDAVIDMPDDRRIAATVAGPAARV